VGGIGVLSSRRMPGQDVRAFLRASPVFVAVPTDELESLAHLAREDTYKTRDYVFMEGDPARWLCLVISGRVKILKHSRTGRDVVLDLFGPGEVFGGVAVIERRPYPAAAQAMESSRILRLPGDAVIALTERYPSIIREMALTIGRRLRMAHESVKSLSVDPVEARLAATLLRLAEREGTRTAEGLALPFHLTRQSLADMAGTTVETTIRVVSRWSRDAIVRDDGGHLALKDIETLRGLAEGATD
jgi:CRP-like cAMP-binding protein